MLICLVWGVFFVNFWAKDEKFVGDIWDCPDL